MNTKARAIELAGQGLSNGVKVSGLEYQIAMCDESLASYVSSVSTSDSGNCGTTWSAYELITPETMA